MLTLTLALAIALVGGLIVVPSLEEIGLLQQAEAKEKKTYHPKCKKPKDEN